ncbi:hypothetical protein C2E23DRAFT_494593 [Lenzites betulinus]|nr:hypothetical protein C2E23DRAFT_494593 [Lenzites betulinus]
MTYITHYDRSTATPKRDRDPSVDVEQCAGVPRPSARAGGTTPPPPPLIDIPRAGSNTGTHNRPVGLSSVGAPLSARVAHAVSLYGVLYAHRTRSDTSPRAEGPRTPPETVPRARAPGSSAIPLLRVQYEAFLGPFRRAHTAGGSACHGCSASVAERSYLKLNLTSGPTFDVLRVGASRVPTNTDTPTSTTGFSRVASASSLGLRGEGPTVRRQ